MTLVGQRPVETRTSWGKDQTTQLERGLLGLGLSASPEELARLRTYGELLLKWNQTFNLLGTTSAETLVRDHLLDSLALLPTLSRWLTVEDSLLVDIGSGAGLPGVVLAIMLQREHVALVEPNGKKTAFLRQAVATLRLRRVQVIEARIEELDTQRDLLSPSRQQLPDELRDQAAARRLRLPHFICRAFTSLARFSNLCRPHLQDGSLLLAMKATRVAEEVQELGSWIEVLAVEPLRSLDRDVQRNLVVMRSKPTPPALDNNTAASMTGRLQEA